MDHMNADLRLRHRVMVFYAGAVLFVWLWGELRWAWWRMKWRAHVAVPWDLRRSMDWPPPSGPLIARRRRRRR